MQLKCIETSGREDAGRFLKRGIDDDGNTTEALGQIRCERHRGGQCDVAATSRPKIKSQCVRTAFKGRFRIDPGRDSADLDA